MDSHRNDHGPFCTWAYNGSSKRARGFWHGDNPLVQPTWAFALRSACGTFWETSRAQGGFPDESTAIRAANAALANRRAQSWR
jgi:hypothetical protein